MKGSDMGDVVDLVLHLPTDSYQIVEKLAARRGTTATQVVMEALGTEQFLQQALDDGKTILVGQGYRAQEAAFPHMQR
jgi:hypothetical protein